MNRIKNYVKLIGVMDCRKHAWKVSRPAFSEDHISFDKFEDMDLSLNSMLVYTIEMRCSVLFRDLIFSLRPIEGWALSTRCMPINNETLGISEEWPDYEYKGIQDMINLIGNGNSRDSSRGVLPCSMSTNFTFTIDFRVLMTFCKTIESIDRDLFDIYCIPLLEETSNLDRYRSTTIKESKCYYLIDESEKINGTEIIGNMVVGHYKMKMALASQFLRQHYSKVKIGIWNLIESKGYRNVKLNQNDIVDIVFYIDKNSYTRLMSMRSHWVADHSADMWGSIVGEYVKNMTPEQFWNFIPAGGGRIDPYFADCYNRVLLNDPGVPCPIMTEWEGAISLKRKEIGDSIITEKYQELFDFGILKDNPSNKYRIQYLNNVAGESK